LFADNKNKILWPSFNEFALKILRKFHCNDFDHCKKTFTAVFGTIALQLIKVFQFSVTYSMKQTSSFFLTDAMLSLISLCVTTALLHWFHCVWLLLRSFCF